MVIDTFSPVAKIASVRLFLSMMVILHWPLDQLDIKNLFLHGDLKDEVYMKQPPSFVAPGKSGNIVCRLRRALWPKATTSSMVFQEFGMVREANHFVFYCHSTLGLCMNLEEYVDDIVITGNDDEGIT